MPSFSIFIIVTFFYMVLRSSAVDNYENKKDKSNKLWAFMTFIYFMVCVLFQIKSNISETREICGATQWSYIMLWTIVPNVLIFGTLFALLKSFPGWKGPFANTLGYLFVQFRGLKDLLTTILRNKLDDDEKTVEDPNTSKELTKMLYSVYKDPTDLINEITPTNWDDWFESTPIKKVFKKEYREGLPDNPKPEIKQLYNFVVMRDLVAEFVWLFLAGSYVIGLQSGSLANLRCINPSDKTKKDNDAWEAKQRDQDVSKTKKVYYISE